MVSSSTSDENGRARAAAGGWLLAKNRPELLTRERAIHRVPYDYAQLTDILRQLTPHALAIAGANSFWIDERKGQAMVGADDASSGAAIRAAIQPLGLPTNSYGVEVTGRSSETACSALQNTCSPLVAGLKIVNLTANSICSIGPVGWKVDPNQPSQPDYSYKVLLTASHCTSSQTSVSGETIYQPAPNRAVGTEVAEAPVYGAATCQAWGYVYVQCRYSDVAVFHVLDSVAIAGGRTALANTAANPAYLGDTLYTGSGVIDVIVGEGVRRIGAYSGQSDALVTHGCVDRRSGITTIYTLCMQRAANSVVEGDSGGLMWVPQGWGSGPTPRPAGVIAQRDPVTTGVYYSKMGLTLGALGYQYFVSW